MKKVLLMIVISVLIIVSLQGCVESSPADDQPNNDADSKLETNDGDALDLNEDEIHSLLHNAIEKTLGLNDIAWRFTENKETNGTRYMNPGDATSSANMHYISETITEAVFLNHQAENVEWYSERVTTENATYTSVSNGEVLKEEDSTESVIGYYKDGYYYSVENNADGTTEKTKKSGDSEASFIFAFLDEHDRDLIKNIDFSKTEVRENENEIIVTVDLSAKEYYCLMTGIIVDEPPVTITDIVAEFTVTDGYFTNLKMESDSKGSPYSFSINIHDLGEALAITPPEGYEDFEEMS